ncbi:hypothetical protein CMESO_504 (nucleomorph) [Chroomonas mesostigmatica CCMP1168]|uniref:Uncharacterized protein n=1 Tax=Chroomonas mesostigmatica CCMP1168 TaxID=1195612 RepID=J7G8S6_9CRYP|nr:hypothetical protein CMESO_504 [Chroomonas mesostigmatica CCMP1168]
MKYFIFHDLLVKFSKRISENKCSNFKDEDFLWKRTLYEKFEFLKKNNIYFKNLKKNNLLNKVLILQKKYNFSISKKKWLEKERMFVKNFLQILSYFLLRNLVENNNKYFIPLNRLTPHEIFLLDKLHSKKYKKKIKSNSFGKFLYFFPKSLLIKSFNISNRKKEIFEIQKKPKIKTDILNINIFYDRFNSILFKNSIKGFTQAAYDCFLNMVCEYSKKLILKLRKLAILRQKTDKKKKEWGHGGIFFSENLDSEIQKKIRDHEKLNQIIHGGIRKFKKRRIIRQEETKAREINSDVISKKFEKQKKKPTKFQVIEENISKTNITLMTFLKGILEKRIRVLKEATNCLCKYHPLYVRVKSGERKKSTKSKPNAPLYRRIIPIFSRFTMFITAEDCLAYFKADKKIKGKGFFLKWFFSVVSDYNTKMFENFF